MVEKRPHSQSREHDDSPSSKRSRQTPTDGKPDIKAQLAAARARADEVKRRLAAKGVLPTVQPVSSASGVSSTSTVDTGAGRPDKTDEPGSVYSRLEALKARIASGSKSSAAESNGTRNAVGGPASADRDGHDDDDNEDGPRARGGLGVGLHPALLGDGLFDKSSRPGLLRNRTAQQQSQQQSQTQTKGKPTPTSSSSSAGNSHQKPRQLDLTGPTMEELRKNVYFDPSISGGAAAISRPRPARPLSLNAKGKFIAQANAARKQARLEEMKKRIEDQARRVELEEEQTRVYAVPAPPAVEWWDEPLVGADYSALDSTGLMPATSNESFVKINTADSPITIYIQHPVPIEPVQDKLLHAPKPVFLTTQEQAKIRRQTRKLDLKEEQAKIRLGLKPAPPPKANKSNMMRVYPDEAVKDPTALEMRVSREIAARQSAHLEANSERKLGPEERRNKLATQQEADAAKGIVLAVFRVETLCFGKHRYQIDMNAKQNGLTGVVVASPAFSVVLVEGGAHSIRQFSKLMLNRIKWQENAPPPSSAAPSMAAATSKQSSTSRSSDMPDWLSSFDPTTGELKDLDYNRCTLVWEGMVLHRAFRRWFGLRICPTETEAKASLVRAKTDHFWTLAATKEKSESAVQE